MTARDIAKVLHIEIADPIGYAEMVARNARANGDVAMAVLYEGAAKTATAMTMADAVAFLPVTEHHAQQTPAGFDPEKDLP
jgi:hypothetical protein